MDLAEKILQLRKANGLTQEQLAERLDVSRQSVSKWESGQAVPELSKITALCDLFQVTTDSLLKPSCLDEIAIKTELLEKRQQALILAEEKRKARNFYTLICLSVFLIALAAMVLVRALTQESDLLWRLFPGLTFPLIALLLAAAAAIAVCLRYGKRRRSE